MGVLPQVSSVVPAPFERAFRVSIVWLSRTALSIHLSPLPDSSFVRKQFTARRTDVSRLQWIRLRLLREASHLHRTPGNRRPVFRDPTIMVPSGIRYQGHDTDVPGIEQGRFAGHCG